MEERGNCPVLHFPFKMEAGMSGQSGGAARSMEQTLNRREWVDWLTRVRLLLIALILGVGVVWPQYVPSPGSPRFFLPIVILWITLGILHLILVRLLPEATWLGGLQ